MQPVSVKYDVDDSGKVWMDRDSLCLWIFEAADEAAKCQLGPNAEFCIRSIAEMLIEFPHHKDTDDS